MKKKFLSLKELLYGNKTYQNHRESILVIIDLSLVVFSFLAAVFLKLDFDIKRYLDFGYRNFMRYFVLALLVYLASFLAFGVQKSLWSYIGMREVLTIALSVVTSTFVLVAFILFTSAKMFLVSITIIAGVLCISLMFNVRVFYRLLSQNKGERAMQKNALIVGAGDGGYLMLKELEQNKKYKARVVGFVDDAKINKVVSGKSVIGTTYELPKLIDKNAVAIVYIAIPSLGKSDLSRIITLCQAAERSVEIKIMKKEEERVVSGTGAESYPIKPVSIADLLDRGEVKLNIEQIRSYIENETILVTGAGGSIGSEICRQIAKFSPKKLVMLDIYENNLYELEQELSRRKSQGYISKETELISVIASVRDKSAIAAAFEKYRPSSVFHAAAHKHVPLMEYSPLEAIKNNVFGTLNVVDRAIDYGASRFILISTDKAVNPTNVMGATKRMAELVVQSRIAMQQKRFGTVRTHVAAVRFGNVLGSNGSVVPLFEHQISEGGPLTITHRDITRYFMTIPEAAQLVLQSAFYCERGEIYILNMGEPVRILELAEKMIRLSGYVPYQDIDIVEIGLRPGEKMYEELRLPNEKLYLTDNSMISVGECSAVSDESVIEKLKRLKAAVGTNDPDNAREVLFDCIKDEK